MLVNRRTTWHVSDVNGLRLKQSLTSLLHSYTASSSVDPRSLRSNYLLGNHHHSVYEPVTTLQASRTDNDLYSPAPHTGPLTPQ